MAKTDSYTVEPFPRFREIVIESVEAGKKMNHVIGLPIYDVTKARELIRKHKEKTKETISFTSFIINCLSKAVNENKQLHGIRKGKRKVIIFDDINIRMNIERELDGKKTAIMYIIRKANEKGLRDIHDEIRRAQGAKGSAKKEIEPKKQKKSRKGQNLLISLPKFIRKIIWWKLKHDPFFIQKNFGTVSVTTLGTMFKGRGGYAITSSPQTLSIALGGIEERPGVVNKKIEIREYLYMTVMFNHDVVDGAPAARFLTRLGDLIEDGYGISSIDDKK
ncbi:MAG: 2-oxo acid dehydrogenase subunit E2 [Candidatus Heimdallarchaeota archaeon]